jgi:hypothetical protein
MSCRKVTARCCLGGILKVLQEDVKHFPTALHLILELR